MENSLLLPETENLAGKKARSKMNNLFFSRERESVDSFVDYLISEGGETFFHYLNGLGQAYNSNMMLLSSRRNYYYDLSDLRGASTVINLKRLNSVPHMKSFLYTISKTVTQGACFAGCFSEFITERKRFRSNQANEISREDIVSYLESIGFKMFDLTEIRGLTYFLARKN